MIGRYKTESTVQVVSKVEEIAKRKGVSMAQIAIAWVLSKPHVTAPIVGTTSLANLEDILGQYLISCGYSHRTSLGAKN